MLTPLSFGVRQALTLPLIVHNAVGADSKLQPIYTRQTTLLQELLAEVDAASKVVAAEADIEVSEPGSAYALRSENVGTFHLHSHVLCLRLLPSRTSCLHHRLW